MTQASKTDKGAPKGQTLAEVISIVEALMKELPLRRVSSMPVPGQELTAQIAHHTKVFCQVNLWRCLDLADTAQQLIERKQFVPAMTLARAIIESVASFVAFEKEFAAKTAIQTPEGLEELRRFIANATFATKVKELLALHPETEATQILKHVDALGRLDKDHQVRAVYDHLCEFLHPNALGCTLWYSSLNPEGETTFSDQGDGKGQPAFRVIMATYLLRHFRDALDRIEATLVLLYESAAV